MQQMMLTSCVSAETAASSYFQKRSQAQVDGGGSSGPFSSLSEESSPFFSSSKFYRGQEWWDLNTKAAWGQQPLRLELPTERSHHMLPPHPPPKPL